MLATVPTSVLGPILPTATPDLALQEPAQQPSPEDLVNAMRTQAEATGRLLMPMNGQGTLPGADGSGPVYRPLSMLAKDSTAEAVTGLPRGGALLTQLPEPSGPVAERLERNVMQLQLGRGAVGPQAGTVTSALGDLKDRGGAGVDEAIRNGKLHLSLASQHSDVVTSVVTEVHMAAQRIIHAEMEKRKNGMYERLRSKLLQGEVPSSGTTDGGDGGRKVKGQVPESSRRILELLTKPKANSPEVFDAIVKLDCQDGKAEKADLWSAFEWATSARDPVPPANAHQFIAGSLGYLNNRFVEGLMTTVYSSGRPYASSGEMKHPKSHAERLDLTFQYGRIVFDDNNFPYSHLHEVWFALYTAVRANFVSVVETLCAEPSLLVACPPLGSLGKALVARMASVKGTGGQQCPTPTAMADFDDGSSGPLQVLLALVDRPLGEDTVGSAVSDGGPPRLTSPDFSVTRVLPNCTAEDWTWFNLMECLHPSFSTVETLTKLQLVQDKIANLPSEYFDDPQASAVEGPGVGGPGGTAMAIADAGPTYPRQRRTTGGPSRSKKASWKLAKLLLLSLQFPRAFGVLSAGSEAQETTAIWMRLYLNRPHGSGIMTALRSAHLEEGESESSSATAVMHYAQKRFTLQETLRFLPALMPRSRVEVLRELLLSHTESNVNGGAEVVDEIVGFIDPETGEVHRGLLHSSALASIMDEKASAPTTDSAASPALGGGSQENAAAAIGNGSSTRPSTTGMFSNPNALALPTPASASSSQPPPQQSVYVETCRYCGRCAVDMGHHGLGMKLLHCAGEYKEVVSVMVRCLTSPALVQEISDPSSPLLAVIEMLMKIYDKNPGKWNLDSVEWDEAKRLYSLLQFERLCASGRYEEAITHFDRHQLLGGSWDRRAGGARASIARRVLNAYVPLLVHAQKSASRDVIRDRVIELQKFVAANVPEEVMRQVSPATLRALSELSVYLRAADEGTSALPKRASLASSKFSTPFPFIRGLEETPSRCILEPGEHLGAATQNQDPSYTFLGDVVRSMVWCRGVEGEPQLLCAGDRGLSWVEVQDDDQQRGSYSLSVQTGRPGNGTASDLGLTDDNRPVRMAVTARGMIVLATSNGCLFTVNSATREVTSFYTPAEGEEDELIDFDVATGGHVIATISATGGLKVYVEDHKHGVGCFTWPDKSCYSGQLHMNDVEGQGEFRWPDGRMSRYRGSWKDNRKHGYGKYTWPDGRVYEGGFADDYRDGTNRVGFVRDLCSDCIHPVDGNLGRTRMAILGQDFSVIAEVNLQSGRVDELKQKLTDAFPDYLVGVKRTAGGSVGLQAAGAPRLQKQLRVCGPDERNILGRFCEYLAQKDIEILDLKSEVLSGSHIGYDVFDTTLTIGIPVGEDAATDHLQQELSRLGEEIGVEATLMPFP
ncbi:hypothetical protein FOZ60_008676 [Perkinsus olseni]|uniref:ACT domain-containing protein n=1 Tax=Perkinsus olseni TaxID=32597 RepID=A0A7J6NIP3_PEROL|nr:hypothetical protein FOZ60_008676 [Perkinsus olseni]